jgi:type II secretory pathway component PulK
MQCTIEDESGKLNINLTRTSAESQAQERGERKTRDAFARDALRRIFEAHNIEVDIVDELQEYWLQEQPIDDAGRQQRIPDFTSLEDFAARFQIPTPQLRELRRIVTATPTRYLRALNANTAPGIVLAAVINEPNAVAAILERQQSEEPFKNAGEVKSILEQEGVEDAGIVGGLFDVRSNMFRLRASALTNVDPEGEFAGGIGQTLSELVFRQAGRCPSGQTPPCWTLKPLDWQKEGGARLLEYAPDEFGEPGSGEEDGEFDDRAYGR